MSIESKTIAPGCQGRAGHSPQVTRTLGFFEDLMSSSEERIHPFFRATNPHGNVRFNFRSAAPEELVAFAMGYHKAGRILVKRLAQAPGYADYDGYPILYLYRHALELYLKSIIYRGGKYIGLMSEHTLNAERFFGSHDLTRLLPAVREVFDHVGWGSDLGIPGLPTWVEFAKLVEAIDSIDHGSYTFRYPMDKRGASALPHHLVLNVVAFGQQMDPVLELLDGAASGLNDKWDNAAEACYFLQEIAKEWGNEA
jgi:hypothetical protein